MEIINNLLNYWNLKITELSLVEWIPQNKITEIFFIFANDQPVEIKLVPVIIFLSTPAITYLFRNQIKTLSNLTIAIILIATITLIAIMPFL